MTTENIETEEHQRQMNDYQSYISTYVDGFISNLFSQGIVNEVTADTLKKYFSNPDTYQKEIESLAQYYYISSAEIHQLYELIEALPTLNYKIDSHDKPKNNDKHISLINKAMHKIKHKRLSRDLLKQNATAGTIVGIWLGDKNNLYPYIFDDVKNVFPAYRGANGEWVCQIDMAYFEGMVESHRKIQLMNLSPHVTEKNYDDYLNNRTTNQYVTLPQERTFVLRTGTLKRNQNMGTSWITAGMYDVLHKKKLKDVEQSIANKVINAVAVLTIGHLGSEKNNDYTNLKLPPAVKKKVHSGVKTALEKNNQDGVTVVTIPDFAKLDFPDVKTDGIGNKFDSINSDINKAFGISSSILSGDGSSVSTAKLNLETVYKRLGVLLEDIEQEVYQKMINLILPSSQKDNYYILYDKEMPLSMKEKIDVHSKMNDKGWSTKHLIDNLSGISWEAYLEQTLYETDVLKLQDKIHPYKSSHTMSDDGSGRPSVDAGDLENESSIKTKTTESNDL